jgi:hypothetical protein
MLETKSKQKESKEMGKTGLTHRKVTFLGVTCGVASGPIVGLVWLGACQSNSSGKCRMFDAHARERKGDGEMIGRGWCGVACYSAVQRACSVDPGIRGCIHRDCLRMLVSWYACCHERVLECR